MMVWVKPSFSNLENLGLTKVTLFSILGISGTFLANDFGDYPGERFLVSWGQSN